MFGLDIKTNMREREWRNGQREILALGFPIQLPPKYLSIDAECIYANNVHSFLLQYHYFIPISSDSIKPYDEVDLCSFGFVSWIWLLYLWGDRNISRHLLSSSEAFADH